MFVVATDDCDTHSVTALACKSLNLSQALHEKCLHLELSSSDEDDTLRNLQVPIQNFPPLSGGFTNCFKKNCNLKCMFFAYKKEIQLMLFKLFIGIKEINNIVLVFCRALDFSWTKMAVVSVHLHQQHCLGFFSGC